MARDCAHHEDTCGTCALPHRTAQCSSARTKFCINCQTDSHSSTDRSCPEFIMKCNAMDEKTPENMMPYFPTNEAWTQVLLPPRSTSPLNPTRTTMTNSNHYSNTNGALRQTTLGEAMTVRQQAPRRGQPRRRGGPLTTSRYTQSQINFPPQSAHPPNTQNNEIPTTEDVTPQLISPNA